MENFLVAVRAIVPIMVLLLIGAAVQKLKVLTDEELKHVNKMIFDVFFFFMMFYNLYSTDLRATLRPHLIIFGVVSLLIVFGLAFAFVCAIEPDNRCRGAMIQAIFRGNFVILGVPIVSNIFGDKDIAVVTMMIAFIIPMYNILGVFTLETFRGHSFELGPIIKGVLKNPMILGAILGVTCMLSGLVLPEPLLKPIRQVSSSTSTIALIVLGASFHLNSVKYHHKQLFITVVARLIVSPLLVMSAAVWLGFRGIEIATLIAIYTTPCAVASYTMAQQMDSDGELAGNIVVFTTICSCFTMFCWVYVLKALGLF